MPLGPSPSLIPGHPCMTLGAAFLWLKPTQALERAVLESCEMTERVAGRRNRRTGPNNSGHPSIQPWLYERGSSADAAQDRTLWHSHRNDFQIGLGLPILRETPSNCYWV